MPDLNYKATDARFTGWYRPSSAAQWVPVCSGCDAASVLYQMLDLQRGGDTTALPAHKNPNEKGWPVTKEHEM